jgi:murein DD-endopeptidase MepM/ murein hydrolase activator NlpD
MRTKIKYLEIIVVYFIFSNSIYSQVKISNENIFNINNRYSNVFLIKVNEERNELLIHKSDSLPSDILLKSENNSQEYLSSIPSIFPLNRQYQKLIISSDFSNRIHPISRKWAFHNGIDLPAKRKSLVYATADGVVAKIYQNPKIGIGYGLKLIHKYSYKSIYGHLLLLPKLSLGDSVTRGQVIGYVGNTGSSTGYHLHYAIYYKNKAVNPLIYCKLLEKL